MQGLIVVVFLIFLYKPEFIFFYKSCYSLLRTNIFRNIMVDIIYIIVFDMHITLGFHFKVLNSFLLLIGRAVVKWSK